MRYTGYIGVPYNAIGHITPTSSNKVGEIGLWQNNCVVWIAANPNYIYPEEQLKDASIVNVYHPEAGIIPWGGIYNPTLNGNGVGLITMAADELPTHIKISPISTREEVGTGHPGAEYQDYAAMNSEQFGFAYHEGGSSYTGQIIVDLVSSDMLGVQDDPEHPGAKLFPEDASKVAHLATLTIPIGTWIGGIEVDIPSCEYLKGKQLAIYFRGHYGFHFRNKAKVEMSTSKTVTATFQAAEGGYAWGSVAASAGTSAQTDSTIACQNGDYVLFNRSVQEGYTFKEWQCTGISASDIGRDGDAWYFIMPDHDVTITPVYTKNTQSYSITIIQNLEYTTIYTGAANNVAEERSTVTLWHDTIADAVTFSGYRITDMSGATITTLGPNASSFTMPSCDIKIYGIYSHNLFNINGIVTPAGYGTINNLPNTAIEGDTVSLSCTAASPHIALSSWTVKNTKTNANIAVSNNSFTMPAADVQVTANFAMQGSHLQMKFQCKPDTGNTIISAAMISWYTTKNVDAGTVIGESTISGLLYDDTIVARPQYDANKYQFYKWIIPASLQSSVYPTPNASGWVTSPIIYIKYKDVANQNYYPPTVVAQFKTHRINVSNDVDAVRYQQVEDRLYIVADHLFSDSFGLPFVVEVSKRPATDTSWVLMTKENGIAQGRLLLTDADYERGYVDCIIRARNSVTASVEFTAEGIKMPHRTVRYYNGAEWVDTIAHYYSGAEWVETEPYYYNGAEWIPCSYS